MALVSNFAGGKPRFSSLRLLSFVLEEVCEINDKLPVPFISKFHASSAPAMSILVYLERLASFTDVSESCFIACLVYIDRIQARHTFLLQSLCIHRLLLTGVMIAAKFLDDRVYKNAFFARVGGIPVEELSDLEIELMKALSWDVSIEHSVFQQYVQFLSEAGMTNAMATKASKHSKVQVHCHSSFKEYAVRSASSCATPPALLTGVEESTETCSESSSEAFRQSNAFEEEFMEDAQSLRSRADVDAIKTSAQHSDDETRAEQKSSKVGGSSLTLVH